MNTHQRITATTAHLKVMALVFYITREPPTRSLQKSVPLMNRRIEMDEAASQQL
jgi:hypothetical protein